MVLNPTLVDQQYQEYKQRRTKIEAEFEQIRKAKAAINEAIAKEKAERNTYYANKHKITATTKPLHLLAKDGHYCCNLNAKVKPEHSTSNPAKSTCKNCNYVFVTYWTAPFFRVAYEENRGENSVPFFEDVSPLEAPA